MKTRIALAAVVALTASPVLAQSQPSSITADLNRLPGQTAAPTPSPQSQATPAPATTPRPQTTPAPAAATPPAATSPAAAPAQAAPAPAPAPAHAALTPAQIAALPFTVTLPAGFRIVAGRSNDSFDVWTIRRGDAPAFVTVYAGERSDYPIYTGREITAGGRTSIVINEGQGQRAVEHIFLRPTAPREIHVWVGSVDDADRAVAEAIAQSVDVR